MLKRTTLVIAFALTGILLLSACERSAVPIKTSQVTPTGGAQQTLAGVDAYKTQTAAGTATALYLTMQPGASSVATSTPNATLPGGITPVAPTQTPMPTVATPNVPTPTPGKPATYKLQEGEFPYCLARRFDVNPNDLLTLNGLSEGQVLQPGTELKIPQTGSFPGQRSRMNHPATYNVAVNDTIYSIACKFGDVDPLYLASYNGLTAPYILQAGKTINIP